VWFVVAGHTGNRLASFETIMLHDTCTGKKQGLLLGPRAGEMLEKEVGRAI
jgi:hypothetical protein